MTNVAAIDALVLTPAMDAGPSARARTMSCSSAVGEL